MRKIFHMKAAMTAAISSKPADFLEPEHSEELIYDNTVLIHQPSISPPQPSVMSQHKLTPTSHHRKALKKIIQRQFGSYSFEPFLVSDEVDARALSCNVLAASSAGAYIPDGKDPDQEDSSIWSDVAFNDSYISICSERGEYVPTTYKGVELPEDSITFGPSRFISSKSSFEAPRSLSGSTLQLDRSISSVLKSCFSSKPTNSKKSKISWADDLGRPLCSIREYNFTQDDRNQRGGDLTALFGHLVEWSTADDPKPHYRWTSDDPTGFFLYADETGGLAFSIQPKLLDRYSAVQRYYARESYFGVIPQGFYGEKDRVLWLFEAGRTPSIEDVYARLPDGRVVY
ncbi:hypothetical protein AOQ84DRAFT_103317 [Glonium stellatum]|uniref:Uncharacterized protein n=1 Tax=Glonium stellatum TaxID=574774 RepID=A0A8E2EUF0_9PEZI|nr:hypothetical protein AOQ84DRAFT_103317 [Glonium stellatum]